MLRSHPCRSFLVSLGVGLAIGLLLAPAASAAPSLGQVASPGAALDGVPVPPGTTLLSPARVEASERPVILHLTSGQAVAVDGGSAVQLETSGRDELRLTVAAGAVSFREPSGAVMTLVATSDVVLGPEGQVREGTPVSRVRLCRLADPEASFEACAASQEVAAGCEWEVLEVAEARAAAYLGVDAVRAGEERNDLGLDDDCEVSRTAVAEPRSASVGGGQKGLATTSKVALGLAAAAGVVVLVDQLDDDDERPASPVTP